MCFCVLCPCGCVLCSGQWLSLCSSTSSMCISGCLSCTLSPHGPCRFPLKSVPSLHLCSVEHINMHCRLLPPNTLFRWDLYNRHWCVCMCVSVCLYVATTVYVYLQGIMSGIHIHSGNTSVTKTLQYV